MFRHHWSRSSAASSHQTYDTFASFLLESLAFGLYLRWSGMHRQSRWTKSCVLLSSWTHRGHSPRTLFLIVLRRQEALRMLA